MARVQRQQIRYAALDARQAKADEKEAARAYSAERADEAEQLTAEIADREEAIGTLLLRALDKDPALDLAKKRMVFVPTPLEGTRWMTDAPDRADYQPAPPNFLQKLVPGAARRHQKALDEAALRFDEAVQTHRQQTELQEKARAEHAANQERQEKYVASHNLTVNDIERGLKDCEHGAVVEYYKEVVANSLGEEADAIAAEIGYAPESRHLVVDLELPDIDAVPEEAGFKYVKSADRIDTQLRPVNKRRALYATLINQAVLKCIDTVFRGGAGKAVDCLTLNGMLDTIDPATGQPVRVCLISTRVTMDGFRALNLRQVQPDQCLRSLKASVSRSPAELLPVRPLVEIDMVDPRFIETTNVLADLDQRPNLMELSPGEFEGLITNLFASMGLETRQTQASRDGGVDCVAFDLRPIFGGKVVIQAKRYKNTVGVSAVRDLFGTVQNEGANRGILVTTSGYGKASHDFAKGKPLELIDGSGLLHLLGEHAGVDARIIMPDEWRDRANDTE